MFRGEKRGSSESGKREGGKIGNQSRAPEQDYTSTAIIIHMPSRRLNIYAETKNELIFVSCRGKRRITKYWLWFVLGKTVGRKRVVRIVLAAIIGTKT